MNDVIQKFSKNVRKIRKKQPLARKIKVKDVLKLYSFTFISFGE